MNSRITDAINSPPDFVDCSAFKNDACTAILADHFYGLMVDAVGGNHMGYARRSMKTARVLRAACYRSPLE